MEKKYDDKHNEAEQIQLNEPVIVYQTQEHSPQSFEEAWAEALTEEEFLEEMESRIKKW